MPPTAIDTGNTGTSVYCTPPPNSMFPIGATPVKCTASDPLGNRSSATFTVTVADTLPPLFSPLADMTVQASGAGGAAVTYSPVAIDQVDNSPSLACTPASGSTFPVGKTTVTCTATDAHNNQSQATFSVTVLAPTDTSPPTIVTPVSMTVPMTSSGGAIVNYDASATDDTAVASFSCTPPSGTVLPLGTTTVSCNAKDTAGNASSAGFTITVADMTPPSPTVPSNITAEAAGPNGAVVTFTASATDVVDGNVPVTCSPASGSVFALGPTTVTCSAFDTHGNSASASFTVTVVDTTPPSLSLPGAIAGTATSASGAIMGYTASANDLVDGPISPVCTPASGSTFPFGSNTVNCTATDAHHNSATGSFAVNVQYSWSGILQPIDPDGSSLFKLGSTVGVKFQLTGASAGITNAVATLTVTKMTSSVTGTDVEAVSTAAASTGNTFRYDPTSGQYVFNLDTKGLSRGTWLLSIDLHDGVTRRITISLK